jgi:stage II sporulation protein D
MRREIQQAARHISKVLATCGHYGEAGSSRSEGSEGSSRNGIVLMRRIGAASSLVAATFAVATGASTATSATWVVHGAGFGHGVGMSAYGAYGYGKHGAAYRKIIDHYFTRIRLTKLNRSRSVRVLLEVASGDVAFTNARSACDRRLSPSRSYVARRSGSSVRLVSESGTVLRRCGQKLRALGSGPIRVRGLGLYRGALAVIPADDGASSSLNVVNEVEVNDYVQGSVPAEVPSTWPRETLKAMAVASRSIALSTDVGGRGFDLYSDTRTQLYGGVKAESAKTNRAVRSTSDEVVTHAGKIAQTTYFSSSGGRTESGFLGAPPVPYLESVKDPYDYYSPLHRWTVRFSQAEIESRLGPYLDGHLRRIKVTARGDSPRIVTAKVIGTGGTHAIDGDTLRSALGLYDRWAFFERTKSARADGQPARGRGPFMAGSGNSSGGLTTQLEPGDESIGLDFGNALSSALAISLARAA